MEFHLFHLMPWPALPDDFEHEHPSAWVTYSNANFDPVKGHELYNRYLDELEYAEALGFDGVCVNEHHQTAYGLMPAPNIIAATLARRTKRITIAILGNALPLRDHPLRVAEEVAMLDVITGGRIISGFVRGIGAEYFTFGVNPNDSRGRFIEACDLIVKAWTEPGPFCFDGTHYQVRYANLWPRPIQKPHPRIFVPSTGSIETIEWASQYHYPFIRVYEVASIVKRIFDDYREMAATRWGYAAGPELLGWMIPIYVAETDEVARREAERHILYLFHKLQHRPVAYLLPPGYTGEASLARALDRLSRQERFGRKSFDEMQDEGMIVFGSPETVRQRLDAFQRDMRFGILVPLLQFGSLPHDLTVKNMELFAREVMPHLRPLGQPLTTGAVE
ncbi:MAG: LLM class flavin-dependent oxidoreductase [Chloroflexi bacterium]|nr:LLM class flavin-dependent oxidoreductase [Chloroflexota bacterium]